MNLLPLLAEACAGPGAHAVLALQSATRSAPPATATGNILKILDNTFLFNVVEDPLERANLKERRKDIYDELVAAWNDWNAPMLPETATSFTDDFSGNHYADHVGLKPASLEPDPELPGSQPQPGQHPSPFNGGAPPGSLKVWI